MNLEYQVSTEQYVMEINNQLADAQALNPTSIMPKLQTLINSGFQNFIIQTIRTCISHYSKDRAIIKYAYVLDKMLKLPVFNQIVQNVIVQFFCDIFIFLLNQKCYNQIDQLKILRKFWLKTIHPRYLQAMKDILLPQTGIDIDQHFKPDVISALRSHYEKKLRLNSEQMLFHLPRTIKASNIVYENKLMKRSQQSVYAQNAHYFITEKPNTPANVNPSFHRRSYSPDPLMNIQNPPYNRNAYISQQKPDYFPQNQVMNKQYFPLKNNQIDRISPPYDSKDPRIMNQRKYPIPQQQIIIQQQNIPFYPEKRQFINENFKRQRLYSQETTRSMTGSDYFTNQQQSHILPPQNYQTNPYQVIQPLPQKKVNYNEDSIRNENIKENGNAYEKLLQKPKYSKILQMMRNDRLIKCKQCGKGFKNMLEHEKHMTDHFQERLSTKEKRKGIQRLMNFDEWTHNRSSSSLQQFDQFYITLSNLASCNIDEQKLNQQPLQLKCKLCNQLFDLKFHGDQWILNNATFCMVYDSKIPMHKTCQEALEDSSSSDSL